MAIQAGSAYIPVSADMGQFQKGIDQGTTKAKGSLKGFAKSAGAIVGGAFAVKAVKDFFGSAVAGAREAIEIDKQTAAVIKSTGGAAGITADHVEKLSNKLQKQQTISDEVVQSGANMLLTFKNLRNEAGEGNDVFDRTVALAGDMSVAMGQDMKSSSILLGKALNDPKAGLSALTRVGVTFTDQQKEQITAMTDAGDVLGAQKIIMGEVESQFAGSAAAQADAGKKMSLAWSDFQEVIGRMVIPILDKLLGFLTKVADWASANPTKLKIIAGIIGGALVLAFTAWAISAATAAAATIAAAAPVIALGVAIAALIAGAIYVWTHWDEIWTWIKDKVSDVFDSVVGFVKGLPGRAKDALVSAWQAFARVWESSFLAVKDFVADRIADVVDFVKGLPGRAKDALLRVWDLFWTYYIGVWLKVAEFVGDRIADVVGFVTGLPQRAKDGLVSTWQTLAAYWSSVFTAVKDTVSARVDDVVGFFRGLPQRIVDAFKAAWALVTNIGAWMIEQVTAALNFYANLGGALFSFFKDLPGNVLDFVMEGAEKLVDLGKKIVEKIIEGIKSAPGAVKDAVGGLIPDSIAGVDMPWKGDGPGAVPAGGGRGSAAAMARNAVAAFGGRITSTYRSPSKNRAVGGSPTSYHIDRNNPAHDIVGPNMRGMFDYLYRNYGSNIREMIYGNRMVKHGRLMSYAKNDHWDHVHVAHQGGIVSADWPTMPGLGANERPAILEVGETVIAKDDRGRGGTTINVNGPTFTERLDVDEFANRMSFRLAGGF